MTLHGRTGARRQNPNVEPEDVAATALDVELRAFLKEEQHFAATRIIIINARVIFFRKELLFLLPVQIQYYQVRHVSANPRLGSRVECSEFGQPSVELE